MTQGEIRYETTKNKLWKDVGTDDWVKIFSEAVWLETDDPTGSDGTNDGIQIDALWINITSGNMFLCTGTTATTSAWMSVAGNGLNKLDATLPPSATDDIVLGYTVGSLWINISADKSWICVDNTASTAIWNRIDSTGTGDVVGPASAVDSNFAAFDSTTGKLIKDSGSTSATFAIAAKGVTNGDSHDHDGGDGGDIATAATSVVDAIVNAASEVFSTLSGFSGAFDGLQALGTDEADWYINYGQAPGSPNTFDLDLIFDRGSLGDAILRWNETTNEFEFLDAGGGSKTNIYCSTVKTTSGIVLDADEASPKTKIFDEGGAGTKNMVFEVETGQSFIFRTVA